eukprot:1781212-Prymnesium_polylepis.2
MLSMRIWKPRVGTRLRTSSPARSVSSVALPAERRASTLDLPAWSRPSISTCTGRAEAAAPMSVRDGSAHKLLPTRARQEAT